MSKTIFGFLLLLLSPVVAAQVYVSDSIPNAIDKADTVKYGQANPHFIMNASPGDSFAVTVVVDNAIYHDLSVYLVDEINYNLFRQQLPFRYTGVQKGISPIRFSSNATSYGPYFLILDNRYARVIDKKVRFEVKTLSSMSPERVEKIKGGMEMIYANLKKSFVFPDFDIHITPCNQVNAFSNPNITLCAELISEMVKKQRTNAITAVLLHELGHSLLNLWGLPGYDNEDTADEFAAALLVRSESGKKALYEVMQWYSEANVRAEAQNMIEKGDRHSLSIQRIRNMERILANPAPVARRWNQVFYQHATDQFLQKTISSPGQFDDVALASSILSKRAKLGSRD